MDKEGRPILSGEGIWSVEDLANYLGLPSPKVMQILSNQGIKVVSFSSRYKHKLFRLEELKGKNHREDADIE